MRKKFLTILAFPYQTLGQYTDGTPLTSKSNAENMKKIVVFRFRPISRFISRMALWQIYENVSDGVVEDLNYFSILRK